MPERGDKFPIEIDVPLPQGKRPSQYLLADLVLDQSFFIPAASIEEARKIRSQSPVRSSNSRSRHSGSGGSRCG
jgi:hypothetical protein